MKIILTTLEGNLFPVEVSEDLEIVNLKALCEQETNIALNEMSLSHNGRPLMEDSRTLASYDIKDNDIVMVQHMMNNLPQIDFSAISVPQNQARARSAQSSSLPNVENLRRMIMSDPVQFETIRSRFPDLADAVQRNDAAKIMRLIGQLSNGESSLFGGAGSSGRISEFDLEAQQRIAEHIRLQNIQQNMEHALEYMPEAFGNVVMLYIDCQVNGHHVKAFVDSGAQMTIMSSACAERCGIMRLVDTRWSGIAKGVGTQKIVGRVHLAQIQIEKNFLTTAFSILEEQPMDMLLGLDLLRRHQCIIDLQQNVLIFKSANIQTRFLTEGELPSFARLNHASEDIAMEPEPSSSSKQKNTNNTPKSSSSSAGATSSSSSSNVSEASISKLLKQGFKREDIIDALRTSNGDENSAIVKLLAKSLSFPPPTRK